MGLKVGEDGRARVDDEAWWAEKNSNKGRERLSRTIQEMPQVLRASRILFRTVRNAYSAQPLERWPRIGETTQNAKGPRGGGAEPPHMHCTDFNSQTTGEQIHWASFGLGRPISPELASAVRQPQRTLAVRQEIQRWELRGKRPEVAE